MKKVKAEFVRALTARMKAIGVSKAELARRMKTSRSSVYRLLDAKNTSVTLGSMRKAAMAVNSFVLIQLERRRC